MPTPSAEHPLAGNGAAGTPLVPSTFSSGSQLLSGPVGPPPNQNDVWAAVGPAKSPFDAVVALAPDW